jgi:hypothetical protein
VHYIAYDEQLVNTGYEAASSGDNGHYCKYHSINWYAISLQPGAQPDSSECTYFHADTS